MLKVKNKNKNLKLISLNIEGHKHLAKVLDFLQAEAAEVICLQEVFGVDVPVLAANLKMEYLFVPLSLVTKVNEHMSHALGELGLAILYRVKLLKSESEYYVGNRKKLPIFFENENSNSMNRVLLWIKFEFDGQKMMLATTHFTWAPEGKFTKEQQADWLNFQQSLSKFPELILTGDFNSPRTSGGVFEQLAAKYQDHIPQEVKTTIDGRVHKSGKDLQLVVDGLFTSPEYLAQEVEVKRAGSDHLAVIAIISKK